MKIKSVCVCGAGTMGSGIAQLAAASGFPVILFELNAEVLDKARSLIIKNLDFLIGKGKLSENGKEEILNRLTFTTNLKHCVADLIIEAIIEKQEAKISFFNSLAEINSPDTIFASNTSSLSISSLGKMIADPSRFAGLHFFNPAPLMKLVEVVKGEQTDEWVMDELLIISKAFGKIAVVCRDAPGFIVNRVARPYYIESLRLLENNFADIETIDNLLVDRGFKMGPFRLMDLIGNDINYAVSCSVHEQLGSPERLKPSNIQKEKVQQGALGKKTNKGYYNYS
jgi:3-hydroxybutyryl-CoA dehydrogenase